MSYNIKSLPSYVNSAGKVTILTALSATLVFAFVFLFNIGTDALTATAQSSGSATTTLTVLNTPPEWDIQAYEDPESSTTTPTNSGDQVSWRGTATDSNGAPYFMIVCEENVAPVASSALNSTVLGSAPPSCAPGVREWAVSASTTSGQEATAATTTTEVAPFSEVNNWFAWVCDDDPENPRCNLATSTGLSATNSSPFHVNRRPVFSDFSNNGANLPGVEPGNDVVFLSTSTDPDTTGGEDQIFLVVCSDATYSTATNDCDPGDFLASTSITFLSDAHASYTLPSIIQDQAYAAYGYLVDEHGHEATGIYQGTNTPYIVANVAPTISSASIILNGGATIILDEPAGETSSQYTLQYVTADANSCDAVGGANSYDEIVDFSVGIFRTGIGSTTCNANDLTDPTATHNENNCYVSSYTPWNVSCTAATSTCSGAADDTMTWNCTFPMWFIADPTDGGTPFETQAWAAAVSGIDDDNATGTYATSTAANIVELQSFPALAMDEDSGYLVYGALEPGTDTGTLSTSTVIVNQGNTGLDQNLSGESMCNYFTGAITCNNSSTSTIAESNQEFGLSNLTNYGAGTSLSSTTVQELELDVAKSVATSTLTTGTSYWGIAVPGTIEFSGDYTGLNTFGAVVAESGDW